MLAYWVANGRAQSLQETMLKFAFLKATISLALMFALAVSNCIAADHFPSKPIKLITGGAPRSVTDLIARPLAERLSTKLGQPVVVETRPGAGDIVAMVALARANPDGYALGVATVSQLVSNSYLFANLPYDPRRDFAPIARLATTQMVVVVHPSVVPNTLGELLALAKALPEMINYAVPQVGSPPHLLAIMLCQSAGVEIRVVPFRSATEALASVLNGDVPVLIDAPQIVAQYVKAGRLQALAVTSSRRSTLLPNTPTFAEAGYAGIGQEPWIGLVTPSGTPRQVIRQLASVVRNVLLTPEASSYFEERGWRVVGDSPEDFASIISEDHATWAPVIRKSGLKLD